MQLQSLEAYQQQSMPEGKNIFQDLQLTGKFGAMDKQDYPCIINTVSETHMTLLTAGPAATNYKFICYCDITGRLPGTVTSRVEGGFMATMDISDSRFHRVMARMEWHSAHKNARQQNDRRHAPMVINTTVGLANGASYPCEVLNVSFSGMVIKTPVAMSMGSAVCVDNLRGIVVRLQEDEIGIKFSDISGPHL